MGKINMDNLVPNTERSPEEVRANGKKGGIASGKKRREQKKFNELFANFLAQPLKQKELKEHIAELGITDKDINNKTALVISMWEAALQGNTKAFELIRDQINEKPDENLNINMNNKLEDFLK